MNPQEELKGIGKELCNLEQDLTHDAAARKHAYEKALISLQNTQDVVKQQMESDSKNSKQILRQIRQLRSRQEALQLFMDKSPGQISHSNPSRAPPTGKSPVQPSLSNPSCAPPNDFTGG